MEDFHALGHFTDDEKAVLREDLYCDELPTMEDFAGQLETAGFSQVEATDMTPSWRAFVSERAAQWRASRERQVRVHGEGLYDELNHFYTRTSGIFEGGNLGGLRVTARKPGG